MGIIFKPLKLLLFALAIYGLLQLEYKDQKLMTHLNNWIQSQKSKDLTTTLDESRKQLRWAKDKTLQRLNKTKNYIKEELKSNLSFDIDFELDDVLSLSPSSIDLNDHNKASKVATRRRGPTKLIPGTKIPVQYGMSERKQQIIQKLNVENEVISGKDKKALKEIFD